MLLNFGIEEDSWESLGLQGDPTSPFWRRSARSEEHTSELQSPPHLCCPLLLLPPIPPSIRVFSNESTLRMRWPKYWSFSFSIIPSKEIPGLISFRMDWLDILLYYHQNQYVSPNIICWKTYAQCAGFGGGAFRKWLVHEPRTIMNECNAYINSYHVPCPYHTLAMVVIFLVFWGTFILFFIVAPSIYIPTNRVHTNAIV